MKNKKKLDVSSLMGGIVIVDEVYTRIQNYKPESSQCTYKTWERKQAIGRPGWIIGERWLQTGKSYWGSYEETPPEWHEEGKRIHCVLVTYWPTTNPVHVPLDGFRLAAAYIKPYPPVASPWLTSHRQAMSWVMRDWPRDKNGQWEKRNLKKGKDK